MAKHDDDECGIDLSDAVSAHEVDGYICEHGTVHLRLYRGGQVFAYVAMSRAGFDALVLDVITSGPGVGHG